MFDPGCCQWPALPGAPKPRRPWRETRAKDGKAKPRRVIERSGKRIALRKPRNTVVELPTGYPRETGPSADEPAGEIAEACFLVLLSMSDVHA